MNLTCRYHPHCASHAHLAVCGSCMVRVPSHASSLGYGIHGVTCTITIIHHLTTLRHINTGDREGSGIQGTIREDDNGLKIYIPLTCMSLLPLFPVLFTSLLCCQWLSILHTINFIAKSRHRPKHSVQLNIHVINVNNDVI